MLTPMLETFIAPDAQKAMQWCQRRWSQTEIETKAPVSLEHSSTHPKPFDLQTALAPESFLHEPHAWSVPFEDFSAADVAAMDLSDWWALKASKGNGGRDVWVVNRHNYMAVLPTVPAKDEYILQR